MPFVVIVLSGWMAFAFGCQRVNYHGAVVNLFGFVQRLHQRFHVMAIDIADVFEAEFVDQRAGQNGRGDRIFHRLGGVMQGFANCGN